jgi:hypothetical protein
LRRVRLLAVPPNAVEVVLFLLLLLRDLGSKTVIGVGAGFAQIDADFGYARGRFQNQLFKDAEGRKSVVESPLELNEDFGNTNIHRSVFLSIARREAVRGFEAFRCGAWVLPFRSSRPTGSTMVGGPTESAKLIQKFSARRRFSGRLRRG